MPNTKCQISNFRKNGFTLMELLVVLAIMAIMLSLVAANISGQKAARNLNIAENELVTNLRKLQSNALASRNINASQSVQYYIIKFNASGANAGQYTLQAVYNAAIAPVLQDLETIKFPDGVTLDPARPIKINGAAITKGCALLAYRLPYAKIIMSDGCSVNAWDPVTDNYEKILQYVVNTPGATTLGDVTMEINLAYLNSAATRTITIRGMSGTILFQ